MLTLDAPRISGGILTTNPTTGLPELGTATYTITAADNAADPSVYYPVDLINSSGAAPALPTALLGNSLTINGGQISINSPVVLPGGAFNVTANNNIVVGPQGVIDVSGQAMQFVDVLATIGGGNINLSTANGSIVIQSGAVLNVGDLAGVGAVNQTSAGTLTFTAPVGGVSVGGSLLGQGPTVDSSGSFVLDTNTLAPGSAQTYDALATLLNAGGFTDSWNIRSRSGDIDMTGLTQARSVTVSADAGNIDISGTIDASGDTPGAINIWAGNNLTLEFSATLDASAATANASGNGGQVWLAASQAGNQQGTLILNVGATIDVAAAAPNGGMSDPVFGGSVTFATSRTATNDGVMLQVNGGTFGNFINGIIGESAWDGVVVVGNQTYTYNQSSLVLTPFVSASGSVVFNAFLDDTTGYGDATYSNAYYTAHNANGFMDNQSAMWSALGANSSTGTAVTGYSNAVLDGFAINQVLVNIRPGVVIKNSGSITIEGASTNPNGIDLSGSAYAGSALNTGDAQTLDGHFGQYDEPIILSLRAAGNLNFGVCTGNCVTSSSVGLAPTLGSLSDGFTQDPASGPVYSTEVAGAGASGAATLFDPAAVGAYNNLSGGLGADWRPISWWRAPIPAPPIRSPLSKTLPGR